MKKLPKLKFIWKKGTLFLIRLNFYIKSGSIKLHLIFDDDQDEPHRHPWNFTSFLLLGAYKEWVDGIDYRHKPFTLIKRDCEQKHKVTLYRFLGVRIPCITIGKYSKKIQPWCEHIKLCDFCQKIGHCVDKKEWNLLQPEMPAVK